MIQRIQSAYLLLGAIAIGVLLLVDALWMGEAASSLMWFSPALLILGAIVIIAAIGAIFLYQDRKRQRKIVVAVQALTLAFIAVLFVGLFLAGELVLFGADASATGLVLAILLPILAYIFFYLARRGIERDIELVRSMDRLR